MNKQAATKTKKFEHGLFVLILVIVLISFAGMGIMLYIHHPASVSAHHEAVINNAPATYVDNKLCLQCHQPQAKEWMSSHHAQAMAPSNSTTVLGNFGNVQFNHHGVTSLFFRRNDKYYVRTEGPDGRFADFEIKYTFGVDPIQQYLIELPGGRIQNFTIAWDQVNKRWFHLYPDEITPPGDVLHWAGRYQNANMMCIGCHTTNYQKNYDADADTYASTWSEINVSCQACHGPGEHHLNWARARQQNKVIPDIAGEHEGLLVDFKNGGANTIIESCAICHSRRNELLPKPVPGQPFMDNFLPTFLNEGLYYPDGQQLAEVYVYNSFRQSKMYQMGVSCTDCHNPHSGKLKAEGNAVCTQCHNPAGDKRFPTAAGLYDSPAHTFHKKGSPGSACVNCHMPAKLYMMKQQRPDHSIRIPRPDLSITLGTPNACNNCHTDKSAQWAADAVKKWYGGKPQAMLHYGEIIAAGRAGRPEAFAELIKLARDSREPAIVRATALDLLHNYGTYSKDASREGIGCPDPEVRRAALSGLENLSVSDRLAKAAPLLSDPIRAVRIEAARILSSVPSALFSSEELKAFKKAYAEFITAEEAAQDMPGANLNLAVMSENMEEPDKAEKYYLRALRIDPDFTPARLNLARLYNSMNRNADAAGVLRDGIKREPAQGELHYSLGLLLAEENQLETAAEELAQAVKYLPGRPRVLYNYALALQRTGQREKAVEALVEARRLAPQDSSINYALSLLAK